MMLATAERGLVTTQLKRESVGRLDGLEGIVNTRAAVELIAAAVMLLGILGALVIRFKLRKGIGLRAIQFTAVILLLPTILILALEEALATETIAALLGTVAGYVLSSIGEDEKPG